MSGASSLDKQAALAYLKEHEASPLGVLGSVVVLGGAKSLMCWAKLRACELIMSLPAPLPDPQKINEELQRLLNELCHAKPADAYGFLSRGLEAKAQPPGEARDAWLGTVVAPRSADTHCHRSD